MEFVPGYAAASKDDLRRGHLNSLTLTFTLAPFMSC